MYCELKNGKYWVWSSRLASLDCMPRMKFDYVYQYKKSFMPKAEVKIKVTTVKGTPMDSVKKKVEPTKSELLYLWAKNLN